MQPQTDTDYKQLLTDVIKKQIIILGPDITLAKARNVQGLTIADDGSVTNVAGNPQELTQKLVDQFMELSGMIVKKTMEPLLAYHAGTALPLQPQANRPMAETPPAAQPTPQAPSVPTASNAATPMQPTQNITGST